MPLLQINMLPPKGYQFKEPLQGICTSSSITLLILYAFFNYFSWHVLAAQSYLFHLFIYRVIGL